MTCSEECMMHANLYRLSNTSCCMAFCAEKRRQPHIKRPLCGPGGDFFCHSCSQGATFFVTRPASLCHGLHAFGKYLISIDDTGAASAPLTLASPQAQVLPPSMVTKASTPPLALPVVTVIDTVPDGNVPPTDELTELYLPTRVAFNSPAATGSPGPTSAGQVLSSLPYSLSGDFSPLPSP